MIVWAFNFFFLEKFFKIMMELFSGEQVVLPEGSKDISVSVPFPVKESRDV